MRDNKAVLYYRFIIHKSTFTTQVLMERTYRISLIVKAQKVSLEICLQPPAKILRLSKSKAVSKGAEPATHAAQTSAAASKK